jgi:hypothetical protein
MKGMIFLAIVNASASSICWQKEVQRTAAHVMHELFGYEKQDREREAEASNLKTAGGLASAWR